MIDPKKKEFIELTWDVFGGIIQIQNWRG